MARTTGGRISGSQFFITRSAWQDGNPTVSYNQFGVVLGNFSAVTGLTGSNQILRITVTNGCTERARRGRSRSFVADRGSVAYGVSRRWEGETPRPADRNLHLKR